MKLVMDQLAHVKVEWTQFRSAVEATIYADVIDPVYVAKIAHLSEAMLSEMTVACDKSLHAATVTFPYMRTAVVEVAGFQRSMMQKMSKEAVLMHYADMHNNPVLYERTTGRLSRLCICLKKFMKNFSWVRQYTIHVQNCRVDRWYDKRGTGRVHHAADEDRLGCIR